VNGNPIAVRPAAPFSAWERSLAFRYLRNKRKNGGVALIAIIAFTAITIAVAVLIIVMSVMNGFREQLLSRILGFSGHAYVQGRVLYEEEGRADTIKRLRAIPGVTEAFPMIELQTVVQGAGPYTGAVVRGVDPADLRKTRLIADNIKQGSLDQFGMGEEGGDLIAIGDRLASWAGVRVGDPLTIFSPSGNITAFGGMPRKKTYTVGAIFSVGMAQYDQAFIYMPLAQAQPLFGMGSDLSIVEIKLANPDKLDDYLPAIRKAAGPGNTVTDWRDKESSFWGALQIERNVMRIILMLIILVAALNIISVLVMLVKNKGRDIAILRTMGASQGAVMRVFFMAGAGLGVIATPVGVGVGILFCAYIEPIQKFVDATFHTTVFNPDVYFLTTLPAKIDWIEVLIVTIFTLLLSCVITLWPAWRGSKIDPVEALRYE
jgi:lipoprotein-releasing system permease protein